MKTGFLNRVSYLLFFLIFLWVADLNGQDVFSKYEEDPIYIDVGSDKQLFIDDYLIEYKRSVDFVMNPPYQTGEILIEADLPCEIGGQVGLYSSLLKEEDGRIRVWYDFRKDGDVHVRYAESTDGINFTKPNLGLYSIDGSKDNNVVIPGFIAGSSVWIDPHALPEHKYKTQTKIYPYGEQLALFEKAERDFVFHSSPDGIIWNFYTDKINPRGSRDTQTIIFWDDRLDRYLMYTRHKGQDPRIVLSRCVRRAEMKDLQSGVENTGLVIWTDLTDHYTYPYNRGKIIPVDYYGATVFPYENVYIALAQAFWHYLPDQSPGMRDVRLLTSRDSKEFTRAGERKVFMGPGPSGRFDSRSVWAMPNPIVMGDEIWIYYVGWNSNRAGEVDPDAPDGKNRSAMSRAIMRLDGFVSVDAPYVGGGEIITRPLRFRGDKLEINADTGAGGSIRVEILDKNGFPLPGFTIDESVWIIGNSVRFPVSWTSERSLESLQGETVRLRFVMQDCKLYSFQFK